MILLNPAGLGLLLVGAMSWAAVGRLAALLERRTLSLAVNAAGGTEEKAIVEVRQHGDSVK